MRRTSCRFERPADRSAGLRGNSRVFGKESNMTQYVKPPQDKPVLVPDPDARRDVPEEEEDILADEAEPGKGENAAGFVKPASDGAS